MTSTKIFTPSIKKLTEETIDITKYITDEIPPVIKTNIIYLEIEDFTDKLTSSLRYILGDLYPTKRIINVEIKTNDKVVLTNHVKQRINEIVLSSDIPEGKINIKKTHNLATRSPIYITTHDFIHKQIKNINNYVNYLPILCIGPGKTIEIEAEIIEEKAAINNSVFNKYICYFNREQIKIFNQDRIDFDEVDLMEIEYNSGTLKILYQDNIKGNVVIKNAFKYLKEYFEDIKTNINDLTVSSVTATMIRIPLDKSGVLTNLLHVYIYNTSDKKIDIKDISGNISFSLEIWTNYDTAMSMVNKGLNLLFTHLDKLIKEIK